MRIVDHVVAAGLPACAGETRTERVVFLDVDLQAGQRALQRQHWIRALDDTRFDQFIRRAPDDEQRI